jgi:hypothetical protein
MHSSSLTNSSYSLDALKSLLIIERTPSPEAEEELVRESSLSLDNLNPTQKTRLEQFLRELVVRFLIDQTHRRYRWQPSSQNEGDPGRNTPSRTIKRERDENGGGEGSRKKSRSGPPVTIDLTDE